MSKKIKQEILLTEETVYLICKSENYKDSYIILSLDALRSDNFNSGKKIEVTKQELNEIGSHRWLISEVK